MTVEFLPDDQPAADTPDSDQPRRAWWWLLAALAVAAGVVWALTRPGLPDATSRPHVTARPAPECHGAPGCAAHTGVPVAIQRLLSAHLPPGTRVQARTVVVTDAATHRRLLVARDITASLDSTTVRIRVQRGGPVTRAIVPDPLGVGSLLLHAVSSGYVVRLQYLAPDTVPPQLAELRVLLHDPRLVRA